MSSDNICPKSDKCSIFNTPLGGEIITKSYRNQYCYNGLRGRNNCKRYLVWQRVGNAPINLLPNDRKSIDYIINEMKEKGDI